MRQGHSRSRSWSWSRARIGSERPGVATHTGLVLGYMYCMLQQYLYDCTLYEGLIKHLLLLLTRAACNPIDTSRWPTAAPRPPQRFARRCMAARRRSIADLARTGLSRYPTPSPTWTEGKLA